MPLQNRVGPSGEILAGPARGTFMGNRGGAIHNERREIVRQYASRRWISCVLEFKGRRRTVMSPNRCTELFYLDEAVALAAGHRRAPNVAGSGLMRSKRPGAVRTICLTFISFCYLSFGALITQEPQSSSDSTARRHQFLGAARHFLVIINYPDDRCLRSWSDEAPGWAPVGRSMEAVFPAAGKIGRAHV